MTTEGQEKQASARGRKGRGNKEKGWSGNGKQSREEARRGEGEGEGERGQAKEGSDERGTREEQDGRHKGNTHAPIHETLHTPDDDDEETTIVNTALAHVLMQYCNTPYTVLYGCSTPCRLTY